MGLRHLTYDMLVSLLDGRRSSRFVPWYSLNYTMCRFTPVPILRSNIAPHTFLTKEPKSLSQDRRLQTPLLTPHSAQALTVGLRTSSPTMMLVAPVGKIVALLAAQFALDRALTAPSVPDAKERYKPSLLATIWQRVLPVQTRVWPSSRMQTFCTIDRKFSC